MKQIRYLHVTYTLAQVTQILRSSMTGENFRQSINHSMIDRLSKIFARVIEDSKICVT